MEQFPGSGRERVYDIDTESNGRETKSVGPIKRKGKMKMFMDYFIDYTENSSLHGLKYIGERKTTCFEKIFWTIMFTGSVVLCAILILKILIKWNESPVIVTFAEKSTPIWQIPYPAVTICSQTKAMPTIFNYTKYYHLNEDEAMYENLTAKEKDMFEHIAMVCGDTVLAAKGKNFSINNIIEVSPTIDDAFLGCMWNNDEYLCEDLFSSVITERGLCYTFNTLGFTDLFRENLHTDFNYLESRNSTETWQLETGYTPSAPLDTYPYRGLGDGLEAALKFYLNGEKDFLDYACGGPIQGFKLILHNPAELPSLSHHSIRIPLKQEVTIAVKPKMITTSEGLRPYDTETRQCYFQKDYYLKYFKVYTQSNCKTECLANFTYTVCGCAHFGFPRDLNMKVCDASMTRCIKNARSLLLTIEIEYAMDATKDNNTHSEARKVASRCKCLPACTSIEYEAETSQADFKWKAYAKAMKFDHFPEDFSPSEVMIYFKEAQFITSRRSELYGLTDFIANCGGLLGLFMGFSFLSLAEIIYFATLRLWCIIRRHHRGKNLSKDTKIKIALD